MITENIVRHILNIKIICNQLILVTTDFNPKITITRAYVPTEEAISLTVYVTFHFTILLY